MQKNWFLKVKNILLELEKHFTGLKDRKLKDREVKIKREKEELIFKPIIVCRLYGSVWTKTNEEKKAH